MNKVKVIKLLAINKKSIIELKRRREKLCGSLLKITTHYMK